MKYRNIIIGIVFALFLILSIVAFSGEGIISMINNFGKKQEIKQEISYEIYSYENGKIKLLIIAEDTENGIKSLSYPNKENVVNAYGKQRVAIDYEIVEDGTYTFDATNTNGDTFSNTIVINDEFRKNIIPITVTNESEYELAVSAEYNKQDTDKYYRVGNNSSSEWREYTGSIRLNSYQLSDALNDDGSVNVQFKEVDINGNNIIVDETKVNVPNVTSYRQEEISIEGESILKCVEDNTFTNGNYKFIVNGEEYPAEVYNYNEDVVYTAQNNIYIGDLFYGGIGNSETDTRMLVLKYNGNITVNEGAKISANTRKKGMLIYSNGTIQNNGEISMTARGASAEGQNVYLWRNSNGQYDFVPAEGAFGADGVRPRTVIGDYVYADNGLNGINGIGRQTGGGGSGAGWCWTYGHPYGSYVISGKGSKGTSYSGGSAGGGVYGLAYGSSFDKAGDAEENGGAGGNSGKETKKGGGGAGNPGGNGASEFYNGQNGTGGLLILYSNILNNNGKITSEGMRGGAYNSYGEGGCSGGGSINIFIKQDIAKGNISAKGGEANYGGNGGLGSVSINNTEFEIDKPYIDLFIGDNNIEEQLTVLRIPAGQEGKRILWESSNIEIAEVDENGKVIIKNNGVVEIKATIEGTEISAKSQIKIDIVAIGETDETSGETVLDLYKYVQKVSEGGTIYIPEGTYRLKETSLAGIRDAGKHVIITGDNEKTKLIWDGADSTSRDGNAVRLENKKSILRNLVYEYYPGKDNNYSNAIFVWNLGTVENVYFNIKGNKKASYSYYNSQQDSNLIRNCTFYFDLNQIDSDYSGKPIFKNIVTNVLPTNGEITNAIKKDFGGNIKSTKTDTEIINAKAGVYFGTNAWK